MYGHAASRALGRTITTLVERYYAAAVAGNGAGACAYLTARLASLVPVVYGQNQQAETNNCAATLGIVFKRYHSQLLGVRVTGVRVSGNEAHVLLGSTVTRASFVIVQREGREWKLAQVLGSENSLP